MAKENEWVFSSFLKSIQSASAHNAAGEAFDVAGLAHENARSPNFVWRRGMKEIIPRRRPPSRTWQSQGDGVQRVGDIGRTPAHVSWVHDCAIFEVEIRIQCSWLKRVDNFRSAACAGLLGSDDNVSANAVCLSLVFHYISWCAPSLGYMPVEISGTVQ